MHEPFDAADPHGDHGIAEFGVMTGDDEVAGPGQHQAAGDAFAVHFRDRRLGEIAPAPCDLQIDFLLAREAAMGVCGVEWFVHPWELGPRKAKELLFTSDAWSAEEAHRLGMVNHVVPRAELSAFVMALAQKIAQKPAFALKLTKEAVNRSVDVMGQPAAIDQAFALHQLCHAHNLQEFGMVVDPAGLHPSVRKPAVAK